MTIQPKRDEQPCFLCGEPTTEIQKYKRIINVPDFPLCKQCKEIVKHV